MTALARYIRKCSYYISISNALLFLKLISQDNQFSLTCSYAAKNGHMQVLQWVRAQSPPCDWHTNACTYAAQSGHLELEGCYQICQTQDMLAWIVPQLSRP